MKLIKKSDFSLNNKIDVQVAVGSAGAAARMEVMSAILYGKRKSIFHYWNFTENVS